jgi:hypothetical protein
MHFYRNKKNLILAFLLTFALTSQGALASLGDRENSIEGDQAALHGSRKMVSHSLYRIHEIIDHQQIVREYVSTDGIVFAVTWRGSAQPDLPQLFGSYYKEYKKAELSSVRPVGRAPREIISQNIIAEKSGHMGDIRGIAYVPSLVPQGFDLRKFQ